MLNMKNKLIKNFQLLNLIINFLTKNSFDEIKLIKTLKDNSIIFDVGSNQGLFLTILSKLSKNKSFYFHSFEPISELLEGQTAIIRKTKHKLISNQKAVSSKEGISSFYLREINSQSSLKKKHFLNSDLKTLQIEVQTISLDKYCEKNMIDFIDLLKIDTEGSELEVLESGKGLFNSNRIEYVKIEINNSRNNIQEIFNFLSNNNYKLLGILNQKYLKNELIMFDAYFQKK